MGITAEAPRGGVVEQIGDATYTLLLRNQEIERFEDRRRRPARENRAGGWVAAGGARVAPRRTTLGRERRVPLAPRRYQ